MKKQNGITLMALIITIVIMLILAFIAISSVSDSDIISQTEDASSKLNNLIQTEDNLRNQLIEELKPSDNPTDTIDPPISGDTGCTKHDYTSEVTTEATCTEDGEKTYTCKNCDASYTEKITKLGHDYKTTTTNATCTEAGTTTETCTRCEDTQTTTVKALEHNYIKYVSNNDATCTSDGTKTGTCARCGEKDTMTDGGSALGHTYGESSYRTYNDWYHTKTTYCGRGADCDGYEYSATDGKYYPGIVETFDHIRHKYDENYYCDLCNHKCSHSYQDRAYYDTYSRCQACGKTFEDSAPGDPDYPDYPDYPGGTGDEPECTHPETYSVGAWTYCSDCGFVLSSPGDTLMCPHGVDISAGGTCEECGYY